jgi:hypothetical protein
MAIIGRSLQAVSEVIQQMEKPALKIGLHINVDKYMNTSRTRQQNAGASTGDINGTVYQEVTDFNN